MRILDCFTFFNEIDLLRLRMAELKDVVDAFVLVEGTHSHSGLAKPVYSAEAVTHLPFQAPPVITHLADLSAFQSADRWRREQAQRDALLDALATIDCEPDDVILLSDADEIPRAAAMSSVVELVRRRGVAVLEQTLHRFYLNNVTKAEDHRCGWCGTLAIRYRDLLRSSPSRLRGQWCSGGQLSRFSLARQRRGLIRNAGWHFTYMGGPEAVIHKRQNFAHAEGDDPGQPRVIRHPAERTGSPVDRVTCSVYGGACPCGCTWGDLPQAYVDPTAFSLAGMDLPAYLTSHPEVFAHWIRPTREGPLLDGLLTGERVDVMVWRDAAAVEWWLSRRDGLELPDGLLILDVRPGQQSPPPALNAGGARWVAFPSATPAHALNCLLRACGAHEIRRWFPGRDVPLPPLPAQVIRDVGGYDDGLPAGEEWNLRWRLARAQGGGGLGRHGLRYLEPAPLGGPLWRAQVHACAITTSDRDQGARVTSPATLFWRLWRAKERWAAGERRSAWREIAGAE